MKTAIICTCLIQHVEGAIKKRPAIATILNKRRDRIGIFKQKKSNYIGFRLDHVISSTNRIDALPPLHIATHPSHPFLDPNPGISYLQGVHLGVCLGVFYNLQTLITKCGLQIIFLIPMLSQSSNAWTRGFGFHNLTSAFLKKLKVKVICTHSYLGLLCLLLTLDSDHQWTKFPNTSGF